MIAKDLYLSVLLVIAAFATFSPSLDNSFVWDDVSLIEKSSRYFERRDFTEAFFPQDIEIKKHKYFRPVLEFSMYTDHKLWGVKPFGYHLTNILLFALCTVGFYFFSIRIMEAFSVHNPRRYAFASSLLFILHPMHVESVSWVSGRTDILCALFMITAFISHTFTDRKSLYIIPASLLLYLSLLSKEVALAFPLAVIFFEVISGRFGKKSLVSFFIYSSVAFLYIYLRSRTYVTVPPVSEVVSGNTPESAASQGINYFALLSTFFNSYLFYIYKLILPFEFSAYISRVPGGIIYFISSVLFVAFTVFISTVSYIRRKPLIAFSVSWVFITLGPSVLVAVFSIASTPLAERYLFVPSAGFCLLLGFAFYSVETSGSSFRKYAMPALVILLLLYLPFNLERQAVWQDRVSLWADTSQKSSDTAFALSNYGKALHDAGMHEEAIKEYMAALDPGVKDSQRGRAVTANNLALVYIDLGEYKRAEQWLERAKDYDSQYYNTYYHLGLLYYIRGELSGSSAAYTKSQEMIGKVLEMVSGHPKARLILANIYLVQGKKELAVEEARKAKKWLNNEQLIMEAEKIIKIDDDPAEK